MEKENQNIEYKQSWHDDYLKTICAFANGVGGTLFIGISDDKKVCGVSNIDKLMEDIPSKIINAFGIIPDLNNLKKGDLDYLSVKIVSQESSCSYKGKYYIRSGSTTQELKGTQLQRFLLDKNAVNWEEGIVSGAGLSDIDKGTIDKFKRLSSKKNPIINDAKSIGDLLDKLHLSKNGKLTRAAILLFGKDPQKFFPGAFVTIGKFKDGSTLISDDEIKGNLFHQASEVFRLLIEKYLQTEYQFAGLKRKEVLEYPELAIREAVINALVHRDYISVHTQVKVEPHELQFWNNGTLPIGISINDLKKKHNSYPRNERIANVFHMAGYIEKWGTGTLNIISSCRDMGLPEPNYEEINGGVQLVFRKDIYAREILEEKGISDRYIEILLHTKEIFEITNSHVQKLFNISKRTATRYLSELEELKLLQKSGETGKGTVYMLMGSQRGQTNSKGAIKGPMSHSKHSLPMSNISPKDDTMQNKITRKKHVSFSFMNEIDNELKSIDEKLGLIPSEKEVKKHFTMELLFELVENWIQELISATIPVIQKFNPYFSKVYHRIDLQNIFSMQFEQEKPVKIVKHFLNEVREHSKNERVNYCREFRIEASYQTFKKGGTEASRFNFHDQIEIKFTDDHYEIVVHKSYTSREPLVLYKKLYHEELTEKEIEATVKHFAKNVMNKVKENTEKISNEEDKNKNKGFGISLGKIDF